MKSINVFTPGKIPDVTFIDDHLQEKSKHLIETLEIGSMLILISGPSKSGKTVFVERTIGEEKLIKISGAGITKVEDLWVRVFDKLNIAVTEKRTVSDTNSLSVNGTVGAQGSVLFAKAKAEGSINSTKISNNTTHEDSAIDYFQLLKRAVCDIDKIIFIDDFHYIERSIQNELARQIKDAISVGCKFICASVPYHSDDVIKGNSDLRGRIFSIDFDYWKSDGLKKIAMKGFKHLNITADDNVVSRLVSESAGSPQLMQYLCLNSCFELGVKEKQTTSKIFPNDTELLSKICVRTVLSTDYSTIADVMKEGPKTRGSERKIYISNSGWQGDVYIFLVKAIALDPPLLTFRYTDLLTRIASLCNNDKPSGSSVTSACSQISSRANEIANNKIIEWDSENDVLDIRDPYLLFFLRWNQK